MSSAQKKKGNGSYRLRILASLKDQMASFDKSRYTIEEVMRMADMTRSQVVNLSKVGLVAPRWRTYSKAGDFLQLQDDDSVRRVAVLRSSHTRDNGLLVIELRHLWLQMH